MNKNSKNSNSVYTSIAKKLFPLAEVESMERLVGGVSADVHRLILRLVNNEKKCIVVRAHRPSHDGHCVELEYKLLQALHHSGLPVPLPLLVDVSCTLLPTPYLLMEFLEGTSVVTGEQEAHYIEVIASVLAKIHCACVADLPSLPARIDPLPKIITNLPDEPEVNARRDHVGSLSDTTYSIFGQKIYSGTMVASQQC